MKSSTSDSLAKLIVYGAAIIVSIAAIFGIMWLIWSLWCWVLPQIYPSGPANLLAPSYWLFVGTWVLVSFVGRLIFGRSRSKK